MSLPKFEWKPNQTWRVTDRWRTLKTVFESGSVQTRSKGKRGRVFILEFEKQNLSKTHAKEIIDFYNSRQGKHLPFRWDYIYEAGETQELVVKFNQDELERVISSNTIYRFNIELVEQFDWIL